MYAGSHPDGLDRRHLENPPQDYINHFSALRGFLPWPHEAVPLCLQRSGLSRVSSTQIFPILISMYVYIYICNIPLPLIPWKSSRTENRVFSYVGTESSLSHLRVGAKLRPEEWEAAGYETSKKNGAPKIISMWNRHGPGAGKKVSYLLQKLHKEHLF